MRKRTLGEEHPDTLTTIANLVLIYSNQGRYKEAKELLERVVMTNKRALGEEHPDTLTTMANLALLYSNQGR
jgi:tetratricopeptide (TPR) repeat protein